MAEVKILKEKTTWDLERKINQFLKEGYEMSGTVTVVQRHDWDRDSTYGGVTRNYQTGLQNRIVHTEYMQVMIMNKK